MNLNSNIISIAGTHHLKYFVKLSKIYRNPLNELNAKKRGGQQR